MKKHLLFALLVASSTAFAQGFTPTRPIELVVHTGPGGGSPGKGEAALLEKVNAVIAEAKASGELSTIAEKWLKTPLPADL